MAWRRGQRLWYSSGHYKTVRQPHIKWSTCAAGMTAPWMVGIGGSASWCCSPLFPFSSSSLISSSFFFVYIFVSLFMSGQHLHDSTLHVSWCGGVASVGMDAAACTSTPGLWHGVTSLSCGPSAIWCPWALWHAQPASCFTNSQLTFTDDSKSDGSGFLWE